MWKTYETINGNDNIPDYSDKIYNQNCCQRFISYIKNKWYSSTNPEYIFSKTKQETEKNGPYNIL